MIDNPKTIQTQKNANVESQPDFVQKRVLSSVPQELSYEYVVVTSSSLAPYFKKLISWKRQKGINAGIVTMDYIRNNYTGDLISGIHDDAGKLRQYLFDAYQNGLMYALLGGDRDHVPIRIGCALDNTSHHYYTIPTDLYFSEFFGDWNVDEDQCYGEPSQDSPGYQSHIYIGRLLCNDQQEIANWTEKLLCYEIYPGNGNFTYLTKAFYAQSDGMQRAKLATSFITKYTMFTTNTVFSETYNGEEDPYSVGIPQFPKGDDVVNEINQKYGFVSIIGHGSPCGVTVASQGDNNKPPNQHIIKTIGFSGHSPLFEEGGNLEGMNNYGYPHINYSVSCDNISYNDYPGHIGHDGNIGKSFTVLTKGGSVAFLGNTRNGYITFSRDLGLYFGEEINAGNYQLGIAEANSKLRLNLLNSTSRYIIYSHNLLGCPEMEMWTNIPSIFNASVTENSNNSLTVSTGGVSGCRIAVISAADDGLSYFQVKNNLSSVVFTNVVKPYYVTITKHDYIPFVYSDIKYIQNQTYTSGSVIVDGNKVIAGENITNLKPQGKVSIEENANVTFQAEKEIILERGFEVKKGAIFEAKTQ